LRFLEDFSEADTAKALSIPLGTVKRVTHRAIAKLRENPDRTTTPGLRTPGFATGAPEARLARVMSQDIGDRVH
jgi:Sigma-70, region 4